MKTPQKHRDNSCMICKAMRVGCVSYCKPRVQAVCRAAGASRTVSEPEKLVQEDTFCKEDEEDAIMVSKKSIHRLRVRMGAVAKMQCTVRTARMQQIRVYNEGPSTCVGHLA